MTSNLFECDTAVVDINPPNTKKKPPPHIPAVPLWAFNGLWGRDMRMASQPCLPCIFHAGPVGCVLYFPTARLNKTQRNGAIVQQLIRHSTCVYFLVLVACRFFATPTSTCIPGMISMLYPSTGWDFVDRKIWIPKNKMYAGQKIGEILVWSGRPGRQEVPSPDL